MVSTRLFHHWVFAEEAGEIHSSSHKDWVVISKLTQMVARHAERHAKSLTGVTALVVAAGVSFGLGNASQNHMCRVDVSKAPYTAHVHTEGEVIASSALVGLAPARAGMIDLRPAVARATEVAPSGKSYAEELRCLTQAIYYEARGETHNGQLAVAQVVMNRVSNRKYPGSVCGVVFQGQGTKVCQFSFVCDGSMNRPKNLLAWQRAKSMAKDVLTGRSQSVAARNATHFHTTAVRPFWSSRLVKVAHIGAHIFYRYPTRAEAQRLLLAAAETTPAPKVTASVESVSHKVSEPRALPTEVPTLKSVAAQEALPVIEAAEDTVTPEGEEIAETAALDFQDAAVMGKDAL